MGYAERSYSYRFGSGGFGGSGSERGIGASVTPWVKRLLIANAVVFLFINVLAIPPLRWAAPVFGFSPDALLVHPWSPLTYMFVHGGFWHLFMNMVVLFFFGPPLERAWGGDEFIRFYLVAGLGAVAASLLLLPVVPEIGRAPVVGASGAIFGLMLAFAMKWPDAPVYIWGLLPVKAKWLVAVLAAVTAYSTFSGGASGVADWAHLGGLATGFVYLRYGGRIVRAADRVWSRAVGDRSEGGPRLRVERGGAGEASGGGSESRGKGADGDDLERVNRILDKIRDRGIDSLTPAERRFLEKMSRRYRGPEE